MQRLEPEGDGGLVEGPDGGTIGSLERDVRLPEPVAGLLPADPERRRRREAIANGVAEFHHAPDAQRGEDCVVEGGAPIEVGALDGDVSEHWAKSATPTLLR